MVEALNSQKKHHIRIYLHSTLTCQIKIFYCCILDISISAYFTCLNWFYRCSLQMVTPPIRLCSGTRWVCKRQRPQCSMFDGCCDRKNHQNIPSLKATLKLAFGFLLLKHVNVRLLHTTWYSYCSYLNFSKIHVYCNHICNLPAAAGFFAAPLAIPRCKNRPSARAKSPWWLLGNLW